MGTGDPSRSARESFAAEFDLERGLPTEFAPRGFFLGSVADKGPRGADVGAGIFFSGE